jgi:hypothetical protein
MFGDSWWTVRIDNPTNAVTTILAVDVKAVDTNVIGVRPGAGRAIPVITDAAVQHFLAYVRFQRRNNGCWQRRRRTPVPGAPREQGGPE